MKIFINPGHGGADCGAVGHGLKEADVALKIGKRVETYLQAVGYTVKLFQYGGVDYDLETICQDANAFKADLFLSIHCNAATSTAKGTETYSSGGTKSTRLAELIQKQLVNSLPVVNRGVKTAGFYVLKHTEAPAVLVETAFIDNADDAKLLRECEDDFARAIARGVTDYFSLEKPLPDVVDTADFNPAGKLGSHFDSSEFTCHCCGRGTVDPKLIELLEQLRAKAGVPIHINCGYRCPKHNAEVGGVPNSQHVEGTAADIYIPQISFDKAAQLVKSLPFDGTGFYPPLGAGGLWFIHVDVRDGGIGSHIEWYD